MFRAFCQYLFMVCGWGVLGKKKRCFFPLGKRNSVMRSSVAQTIFCPCYLSLFCEVCDSAPSGEIPFLRL